MLNFYSECIFQMMNETFRYDVLNNEIWKYTMSSYLGHCLQFATGQLSSVLLHIVDKWRTYSPQCQQ